MISYHIISQPRPRLPPRPRPRDTMETGNLFQELYSEKLTFKKSKTCQKDPQENSVHFHCWIATRSLFSNQFWIFSVFISYDIISWDMISYHMIWYHMISYRSRGRGCRRGRGLAVQWKTWNFFQELYPEKMTLQKSKKCKKDPQENSVHFRCWIITRSFFSNQFWIISIFILYDMVSYRIISYNIIWCHMI